VFFINFHPEFLKQLAAAGPFTTNDNLAYEPLVDLFAYARKVRPNVLILVLFAHFRLFLIRGNFTSSDSLFIIFSEINSFMWGVVLDEDGSICGLRASTNQARDCRQVVLSHISGRD
jgi:hypothetical protein